MLFFFLFFPVSILMCLFNFPIMLNVSDLSECKEMFEIRDPNSLRMHWIFFCWNSGRKVIDFSRPILNSSSTLLGIDQLFVVVANTFDILISISDFHEYCSASTCCYYPSFYFPFFDCFMPIIISYLYLITFCWVTLRNIYFISKTLQTVFCYAS